MHSLIVGVRPDEIYNLASVSRPQLSWDVPLDAGVLNAVVPHRLYEIVRQELPSCRIYQASSSEIFGDSPVSPQNEETPFRPQSPYGIAKLYAHHMAGAYRRRYGLFVCSGILFNHESPRRPLQYVSQKICHAAACLALGLQTSKEVDEYASPILRDGLVSLGNLDVSRREFRASRFTSPTLGRFILRLCSGDLSDAYCSNAPAPSSAAFSVASCCSVVSFSAALSAASCSETCSVVSCSGGFASALRSVRARKLAMSRMLATDDNPFSRASPAILSISLAMAISAFRRSPPALLLLALRSSR